MTEADISFQEFAVVACGTLAMELNHLKQSGFLNARKLLFTKPGRHEVPKELEIQLAERIRVAKRFAEKGMRPPPGGGGTLQRIERARGKDSNNGSGSG